MCVRDAAAEAFDLIKALMKVKEISTAVCGGHEAA
jgi:hypothetical protein